MSQPSFSSDHVPTVGFVPASFPRDPVEINQFGEHMILGQILEPLVEADRSGDTVPGLAESWHLSEDGKILTFNLRKTAVFSSGAPVTAKDVKATLERNIHSKSQSANFIKNIVKVDATSLHVVVLHLHEHNVSLLKALSRDQLGILPAGWKFDSESKEPYVGSGAYRLVREDGHWNLISNSKWPKSDKVAIKKWELAFLTSKNEVPEDVLPDYVPIATLAVKDAISKEKGYLADQHVIKEQVSFAQTSAWWYPHGVRYKDTAFQHLAMEVMRELIEIKSKSRGFERATGIVPVGVAGHLPEQVKVEKRVVAPKERTKLKIAGFSGVFDFLIAGEDAKAILEKYNVEPEMIPYLPPTLKNLKDQRPDIVMGSWAGGFNDPDGFLPLLNDLLDVDFVKYLGDMAPTYLEAREAQDWTTRSGLFRNFNRALIEKEMMVPGWKVQFFSITKKTFSETEVGFRYTPRFVNVKTVN